VALVLPLWLGSCAAGTGFPSGGAGSEPAAQPTEPLTPIPQPQAAPPAGSAVPEGPSVNPGSSGDPPTGDTSDGTASGPGGTLPPATSGPAAGSGSAGQAQTTVPAPAPDVETPPPSQAPDPGDPPRGNAAGTHSVTAYYVLLDDGGSSGIRFGCNDSLVGVRHSTAGPAEPLPAAVGALLDGTGPPTADVYNSLSGSTLDFLAGSFDGTTVTVYLAGTLRPGGVCDIPRIEAQLTQTAVSAVGAIRAEVYVNGVGLAEALSLK
jgi:hypothetical protein